MKKIKNLLVVLSLVLAGTFLLSDENVFKAENTKAVVIEDGVYIGGIAVGGMNAEEATAAIENYLQALNEKVITLQGPKETVDISFGDMGYSANTSVAVQEALTVANSGNLISRFKVLTDLETESYVIDMGLSIDKQKTAQIIHDKLDKLNVEAIDYGLKRENGQFVYIEGQIGDEVDIVTSVNALNEYVGTNWENPQEMPETVFALTSIQKEPRGTKEELAQVKDLLGSFSTSFSSSGEGRAKNVTNGCAKINGTLLYPGDVLSVYELASPFTKANGYGVGSAYVNGEVVDSVGGGVCQVSTTLYNAALRAELEIVERFNHSMTVSYVELAEDAAIAGTYKDLKIKNNYNTPVYVEGYCKGSTLVFNIYGKETRDANRTVSYVSEKISTNNPDTEYTLSSSASLGSYRVTRSKYTGYVAKLWKVVKVDGVEIERTQVNKSTYKASSKRVTIGTAGATPEQLAAINEALATKNDSHIQSVVKGLTVVTPQQPDPEPSVPSGTTTTPDSGTTTPSGGTNSNNGTTTPNGGTDSNNGTGTSNGGINSNNGTGTSNGGTNSNNGTGTSNGGTNSNSGTTTPSGGANSDNGATTTPDNETTTSDAGTGE